MFDTEISIQRYYSNAYYIHSNEIPVETESSESASESKQTEEETNEVDSEYYLPEDITAGGTYE